MTILSVSTYSQPNSFECSTAGPVDYARDYDYFVSDYCDFSNYSEGEYATDLTLAITDVEFHIIANDTGEEFYCDPAQGTNPKLYLPTVVANLLGEANYHLSNPEEDVLGSPGQIGDTRIRFRFNPDPNNSCDGFSFYNDLDDIPATLSSDKLHIILFEDVTASEGNPNCFTGGRVLEFNLIRADNLLHNLVFCQDENQHYAQGRSLNHEYGHILGLPHGSSCLNDCFDMNPFEQCTGPNGPDDCAGTWGNSTDPICSGGWTTTNNMMTTNPHQTAITPCQWDIMMNSLAYNNDLEYVDFCVHEVPDLVIPAGENVIWNDHPRFLNQNIFVEKGATLTISCEVRMGTDKRITVKRGAKLTVDHGMITNLCREKNWEGIVVHGNADKEQPDLFGELAPDDAGIVHILNESIIQNADIGVHVRGKGFASYEKQVAHRGGLVVAENSFFRNNRHGVKFMRYEKPNKSRFINCVFEEMSDCEHETVTGVGMWACRDILFEGNTFRNLDGSGIQGVGLGIDVLGGNTFQNLFPAIFILNTSSSTPGANLTRIGGGSEPNIFENNPVHILSFISDELSRVEIRNNIFSGGNVGAEMNGPTRFFIRDNNFSNMDQGVRTLHTGSAVSAADCNTFENIQIPIEAEGNNRNFTFSGNVFEEGLTDVLIREFGAVPGEIRSVQGDFGNTPNNCFSKTNQSTDILTGSNTISFTYLFPDAGGDPCIEPEVGNNNYIKQGVQSNSDICGAEYIYEPPTYGDIDLHNTRDSINDARTVLSSMPANQAALQKLSDHIALEDIILKSLLKDKISQSNYLGAESLLDGESSFLKRRLYYTIKLAAKDYTGAENVLSTFPTDNLEDVYFVATQHYHLAGLTAKEPFTLTAAEKEELCIIRNSKTMARNYAEALLWLYDNENYEIGGGNCNAVERNRENIITPEISTFRIYPNPASHSIVCDYSMKETTSVDKLELIIYNISGQQLMRERLHGTSQQSISISGLSEGVYFVTVRQDGKIVNQDKLIVIK